MKILTLIKKLKNWFFPNVDVYQNQQEDQTKESWYIELDGQIIGEFVDPEFEDMFWYSWKIIPKEGFEEILFDYNNWNECRFEYRNKRTQKYAQYAFSNCIITEKNNSKYTSMRALY